MSEIETQTEFDFESNVEKAQRLELERNRRWEYFHSEVVALVERTDTGALLKLKSRDVVVIQLCELLPWQLAALEKLPKVELKTAD